MIGGEFPIAVTDILNVQKQFVAKLDEYMYSSGRAALYQILKFLKSEKGITRILLPDYLCSTILVPIHKLKLDYAFFPLNDILELEASSFSRLYSKKSSVLLINYFGLQDLTSQINAIKSIDEDAIIIEDDVQAYYEYQKPLGKVDFKYTSLRKTFAIPDGGLVKSKYTLPVIDITNTFGQYKAAAAMMKSMRDEYFDDEVYLEISKLGGNKIDEEIDCGISNLSKNLYYTLDTEIIREKRQANARHLTSQLRERGVSLLLPLSGDAVPLFIPVLLPDRDKVRKRMFDSNIFCPVHWPVDSMPVKKGEELWKFELSLIIDQRYYLNDMNKILLNI